MPGIGPGVWEIRIQTELEHRVFYVATFEEAVYVLHAFEKRTRCYGTRARPRGRPPDAATLT